MKQIEQDTRAMPTISDITRNYYVLWWFCAFGAGFLNGIYPLFLRSRGLDQFQVNSILATYFVVMFLTDVPTGAFADAISRRTAFVISCAIRTMAFVLYFFSHHYLLFLIAEAIDGIGTTFGNGAIDAWAVDALDEAGFEGVKDRLFSRSSQLVNLGFGGSALIGAYVASINLAWPWLLGAAGWVLNGVVGAVVMKGEPPRRRRPHFGGLRQEIVRRIGIGFRQGFRRRTILLLALANAAQMAAWAPLWMEWPRYFNESLSSRIWLIGWLFCLFGAGRLIGAELIRYRPKESSRAGLLAILGVGVAAALIAMGAGSGQPVLVMALYFVQNTCSGAIGPLSSAWFNEQVEADNRATLLSFFSTFATLGGSAGLLINGRVTDLFGLPLAWRLSGLIALGAAPCYWALRPSAEPAAIAPVAAD